MRRRPGIQGLQRRQEATSQYKALGEDLASNQLERMREQLAVFRSTLEDFAFKHRAAIKQDPVFRAQFHKMCANVGVDPLASNKGMWSELLGLGDFYYELGVQIVEACLATRPYNGGLIPLDELTALVQKRRGRVAQPVSTDDVKGAIKQLKGLGCGYGLFKLGLRRMVASVPVELNRDHNTMLEFAQATSGLTVREAEEGLGWEHTRTSNVLKELLKDQIAMVDDGAADGLRRYWFPCISFPADAVA
mmetsp:Transcript_29185/g.49048  ORF Transcript_29185/g.49048 Transcript_29185/m.49048 type:complete len:248 (+) Transcript_29185:358-1101(+)